MDVVLVLAELARGAVRLVAAAAAEGVAVRVPHANVLRQLRGRVEGLRMAELHGARVL